jgi:hypothetical protein
MELGRERVLGKILALRPFVLRLQARLHPRRCGRVALHDLLDGLPHAPGPDERDSDLPIALVG